MGSGGSMDTSLKLEGIDGRAPSDVELAAQFDSTRENLPGPNVGVIDRLTTFLDSSVGGAWSHLVGAVICQVYSGNERDLGLLTRFLLRGTVTATLTKFEAIADLECP